MDYLSRGVSGWPCTHRHDQTIASSMIPRLVRLTYNPFFMPRGYFPNGSIRARVRSRNDWKRAHVKNRDLRDRTHVHKRARDAAAGSARALPTLKPTAAALQATPASGKRAPAAAKNGPRRRPAAPAVAAETSPRGHKVTALASDACGDAWRGSVQRPGTIGQGIGEAGRFGSRTGALRVPRSQGAAHRAAHPKSSSAAAYEAAAARARRRSPPMPPSGRPGGLAAMAARPASDGRRWQRLSRASQEGWRGKDGRGFEL